VVIHTVRGPVTPADLGRTLTHEHVFCDFYRVTVTIANPQHVLAW